MIRSVAVAFALCIASSPVAAADARESSCVPDTAVALAVLESAPALPVDWIAYASQGLGESRSMQVDVNDEPPAADAPLDTVAAYWLEWVEHHAVMFASSAGEKALVNPRFGDAPSQPADAPRARLFEACVEKPGRLRGLLDLLPASAESDVTLLGVVDRERGAGRMGKEESDELRGRLRRRGYVLRGELIAAARGVHDSEGWIEGDDDLRALAALDPESARPILAELATTDAVGPSTRALAVALQYRESTRRIDETAIADQRARLQAIVGDRSAAGHARDLALKALMASEWQGREAYFLGLFADATLMGVSDDSLLYRPLAAFVATNPDYWIPRMAALVGSLDRAVHDNAVTCLVQFHLGEARADALRPLLPWLANPEWSAADDRLRLIQSLDRVDLPESVPGLLKVAESASEWELSGAAEALAHYQAASAIAPLRTALERERDSMHRRDVAGALIALGAISEAEAAEAIEAWLRHEARPEAQAERENSMAHRGTAAHPPMPAVSIGEVLASRPGSPGAAARLLSRARALERTEPDLACSVRRVAARWPLKVVDQDLVERLKAGSLDAHGVSWLLTRRSTVDAGVRVALRKLAAGSGARAGVAAAILGGEAASLVQMGGDLEAQRGLLIAARRARIPLPLAPFERLFRPTRGALSGLAERYLEVIDLSEARALLLAQGTPRVLGARPGGDPGHDTFPAFDRWEERLLGELARGEAGSEVFALLCASYWGCQDQVILTMRPGGGELRWYDAPFRHRVRQLDAGEVERVRSFVADYRVDELPMSDSGALDGVQYEYVHLRANGGVRVFMNNPSSDPRAEDVHGQVVALLKGIVEVGSASVRYTLSEQVAGVEVLYANWRQPVDAVRVEGESVWVRAENDEPSVPGLWHRLEGGALGASRVPNSEPVIPSGFDVAPYSVRSQAWTANPAGTLVRGSWRTKSGTWLIPRTGEPRLLFAGNAREAQLSSDGKWLLAEENGRLTVVEVSTGLARDVNADAKRLFSAVTWVAPLGRFVLAATDSGERDRAVEAALSGTRFTPTEPQAMVLDPANGTVTPVAEDPSAVLALRGQQTATAAGDNAAWVAVPQDDPKATAIGRVDLLTLAFTPAFALPELPVRTENIWVDEKGGYLYVAMGDLLRIPLSRLLGK